MKRILITGGAGFIGSHLTKRLLDEGNEVIVVDNFFTGSKKNLVQFKDNPRFELIRHDITEPLSLEIDQIYNLACPASPVHYQHDPIKTIECSTIGVTNILRVAKKCKARVLQASTSEVYGDPLMHPQKEVYWGNVNPIGIRSCYDEGKRVAETLCMDYHRQEGVNVALVRIFNTYGPNMSVNDGRVVSNFICQALQNKDITIYGDGTQTRSFCFVSDLVEGFVRMMNSTETGPINLGNPSEFTMLELAQLVIELTSSDSKIVHLPLPSDDPNKRKPDISLAKEKLNWEPKVDLREGLLETIKYFKSVLE